MILVSNDDGIHSEGYRALSDALKSLGDVVVVAPDRERSAVSHSLTLHRPLRVEEIGPGWFAVNGTPTDCVQPGRSRLAAEPPALVVSGINKGANLGDDVTYSGTVSAAMEGTLLGIPSIAISLVGRARLPLRPVRPLRERLAGCVLGAGLPPSTLLNVNVPETADGRGSRGASASRVRAGGATATRSSRTSIRAAEVLLDRRRRARVSWRGRHRLRRRQPRESSR